MLVSNGAFSSLLRRYWEKQEHPQHNTEIIFRLVILWINIKWLKLMHFVFHSAENRF